MKSKNYPLYAEFVRLIELPKVEAADVEHLTPEELQQFRHLVNLRLNSVTGEKYQKELHRFKAVLKPEKPEVLAPANNENHEFDHLFALEKIERSDVQHFTAEQKSTFREILNNKLTTLTDAERDVFIEKVSPFLDSDKIWEINHARISDAVIDAVSKYGCMPGKSYLMKKTGLSKATVYKHMQSLKSSPLLNEQNELFALMSNQVLAKVLQTALHGDMGAAKLYLNTMTKQNTGTGNDIVINNQNNIQINRTVLNQQTIQQLKPEQLEQIEEIIKRSLAEKNE